MTQNNNVLSKARKPSEIFRIFNIIYYAMLSGTLIFLAVIFLQNSQNPSQVDTELLQIFTWLVPVVCLVDVTAGYFLFPKFLNLPPKPISLLDKLQAYFRAKLIQLALFEGAGLFSLTVYYLTASQNFAFWYIFVLCVFALNRPSESDAIEKLKLSETEIGQIKNDQEF